MLIKQALAVELTNIYKPGEVIGKDATLDKLINPMIANALIVSGLVAFGVILLAGFSYISGAGDKNKLTQSTNMLNYGILGLIVVAAAFVITKIIGGVLGFTFF